MYNDFSSQSVECNSGALLSSDGSDLTGAYLLETLGLETLGLGVHTHNTHYSYMHETFH